MTDFQPYYLVWKCYLHIKHGYTLRNLLEIVLLGADRQY